MEKYFIGADGGGTKTQFVLCGGDGKVLAQIKSGCSNPINVGVKHCADVLQKGISVLLAQLPAMARCMVFAGIAGAASGNYGAEIAALIPENEKYKLYVGSDIVNALNAAFGFEDGLAVIGGTGSSCYVRKGNAYCRVGGGGWRLDRGGSGYAIAVRAFDAVLRETDGRGTKTCLSAAVAEKYGAFPENLSKVYDLSVEEVASFAKYVFQGYEQKDEVCASILQETAAYMAELVKTGFRVSALKERRAALVGGLFQDGPLLSMLSAKLPDCNFFVANRPAVLGAALEAVRLGGEKTEKEFAKNFIDTF